MKTPHPQARRAPMFALAIAAVVTMAGCSATPEQPDEPASEDGALAEIGFAYPFEMLPVYTRLTGYAQTLADDEGVKLNLSNDQAQLERQIATLTAWQGQGMQAIVCFPLEGASAERIAAAQIEAGNIWITYGGTMENQSGSIDFDDYERGRALAQNAAEWAEEAIDGAGTAALLIDESIELGRNRTAGLRDGLAEFAPGIEIVAEETATGAEQGLSATNAIIAQHPDVNIILAISDDAGVGVYTALLESGRSKTDEKTYVGGMDGNAVVLKNIQDGTIYRGSAALSVRENGEAIIRAAQLAAAGEDAKVIVPVVMLDQDSPEIGRFIEELGG